MHYFYVGMELIHEWGGAQTIVMHKKNVEWDIFLQRIFLYLQDKVVEKTDLEK